MKKNDDFELLNNLPEECKDPEITQDDFTLTNVDESVHEQKFQTKPTTFLKDSLRRFSKNKSSVVAAYILGFLILLGIIVPIVSPYDVSRAASDTAFYNLEPKLFDNANGFWDGTVKKEHIAISPETGYPNPKNFPSTGISNLTPEPKQYTSTYSEYANGGYVELGYLTYYGESSAVLETVSSTKLNTPERETYVLDLEETTLTITNFETVDEQKIVKYQSKLGGPKLPSTVIPEGFTVGNTVLNFVYVDGEGKENPIPLTENKVIHNTGSTLEGYQTYSEPIVINDVINDYFADHLMTPITEFKNFFFKLVVTAPEGEGGDRVGLIKNLCIVPSGTVDDRTTAYFVQSTFKGLTMPGISFVDANEMIGRNSEMTSSTSSTTNLGYWRVADLTRFVKGIHLSVCQYASFTFDSYAASLGVRDYDITKTELDSYKKKKWINYSYEESTDAQGNPIITEFNFKILNKEQCPINKEITIDDVFNVTDDPRTGFATFSVHANVTFYKYLGYSSMPKFLFGTDKTGRDMFKYVFEGLRNSLLLGLFTFIICFTFGLIWGSISGYFGGAVDIIMERITDILSGIPWIVVMTLVILKTNESSFWTLALALCLTGWIGTAALTRTQFYRFRGREYVLASRTLGASHGRLIAKHILPNAMGTIITSCVLMIPAIIFQEATISYLGLGFKNLSSLGVILSNNQSELLTHPYQLIFPSIVIALLMISFNLFGNGLRDAINPSLKGEDE